MRINIPQEVSVANRQKVVLSDPDVKASDGEGLQGFLYRPGQLLVTAEHEEGLIAQLEGLNFTFVPHSKDQPDDAPVEPDLLPNQFRVGARTSFGVVQFLLHRDRDIPALVAQLRDPRVTPPPVSANHILFGQHIMGNPDGPPDPAAALDPDASDALGNGVAVAILDTGIALKPDGTVAHPLLRDLSDLIPVAFDTPDGRPPTGILDDQGGHGTFIAGIVRQLAPGARLCIHRTLNSNGYADELQAANDLVRLYEAHKPQVINLSYGGYSQGDVPLLPFTGALSALDPQRTVVVASAGNQGSDRPVWPAAMKGVVAVGALAFKEADPEPAPLADDDEELQRAPYSNFGWWVDVWAIGDWVSTFLWFDDPQRPPGDGSQLPARDFDGWARWEGTSFAAPTVAAAIAALMSESGLTAPEAAFRLTRGPAAPGIPGIGTYVDPAVL